MAKHGRWVLINSCLCQYRSRWNSAYSSSLIQPFRASLTGLSVGFPAPPGHENRPKRGPQASQTLPGHVFGFQRGRRFPACLNGRGSPPSGSLPSEGIIAYAAELGVLVAPRLTSSNNPRIPVSSPPDRRFSPPPGCLRHRLPSQVEPRHPGSRRTPGSRPLHVGPAGRKQA